MEPSTLEIGSLKKELPDAVLGGRYPPSSKNRNLLEPVTLEELKKETHHGGKLIYLKVREWAWSTGWLLVVEDSKGTIDRMHVLCDVFQGKKEEAKTGALIAVKEPFYGMCALHVDAIRVDHPSDVILISRHDSTACELFPGTISSSPNTAKEWIDVANKYFDEGDMTEVLICCDRAIEAHATESDPSSQIDEQIRENMLNIKFGAAKRFNDLVTAVQVGKTLLKNCKEYKLHVMNYIIVVLQQDRFEAAANHMNTIRPLVHGEDEAAQAYMRQSISITLLLTQAKDGAYDFESMIEEANKGNFRMQYASFVGPISLRGSPLNGRGRFANRAMKSGELLLCEKALALVAPGEIPEYTRKLHHLEPDHLFSREQVALLQAVHETLRQNPARAKAFFGMFTRGHRNPEIQSKLQDGKLFDSSLALSIIRDNTFEYHYDEEMKPEGSDQANKPSPERGLGIWAVLAQLSHSCCPNCLFTNIGNMVILRPMRDIAKGEELTISHVGFNSRFDVRSSILEGRHRFTCNCALCQADRQVPKEKMERRQTLEGQFNPLVTDKKQLTMQIKRLTSLFDDNIYKDLPRIGLARWLLQLGIEYAKSNLTKDRASECFVAVLESGHGIRIVKDAGSMYCELAFQKYCYVSDTAEQAIFHMAAIAGRDIRLTEQRRQQALYACLKHLHTLTTGAPDNFSARWNIPESKIGLGHGPKAKTWDEIKKTTLERPPHNQILVLGSCRGCQQIWGVRDPIEDDGKTDDF